jgi:hypothetical protein
MMLYYPSMILCIIIYHHVVIARKALQAKVMGELCNVMYVLLAKKEVGVEEGVCSH